MRAAYATMLAERASCAVCERPLHHFEQQVDPSGAIACWRCCDPDGTPKGLDAKVAVFFECGCAVAIREEGVESASCWVCGAGVAEVRR